MVNANTFCCHSNFTNNTFDSEWGQTALDIEEIGRKSVKRHQFSQQYIQQPRAALTAILISCAMTPILACAL